jgi:hypothetical protein
MTDHVGEGGLTAVYGGRGKYDKPPYESDIQADTAYMTGEEINYKVRLPPKKQKIILAKDLRVSVSELWGNRMREQRQWLKHHKRRLFS